MIRFGVLLFAACVLILVVPSEGQEVTLSLDLYYSDPLDINSGGYWELVATSTDRGLASATIRLADVDIDPVFLAPAGSATEMPVAGFHQWFGDGTKSFATDRGDHLEMLFAQIPVSSPGPQALFYDVGLKGGATQPGEMGTPTIVGFTAERNVPWSLDDRLGDLVDDGNSSNNSGIMHGGVLLAAGSFPTNAAPTFFASPHSAANVFSDVGSPTAPGSVLAATITTEVRDNSLVRLGDANLDGTVDDADFNIWRPNVFSNALGWHAADFNGDGGVDGSDFNLWNLGRRTDQATRTSQVPETSTFSLFVTGLCVWTFHRSQRRTQKSPLSLDDDVRKMQACRKR